MWTLGKHPHCVELIDSWEQCGFLYLQLKFYDGGSLESYLQSRAQSPLPESLIWSFVADLALGLQHIHMHNYIHLDLKPSNIFLYGDSSHHPNGSWRLAIGDFGLTVANGCGDVDREGDRLVCFCEPSFFVSAIIWLPRSCMDFTLRLPTYSGSLLNCSRFLWRLHCIDSIDGAISRYL